MIDEKDKENYNYYENIEERAQERIVHFASM